MSIKAPPHPRLNRMMHPSRKVEVGRSKKFTVKADVKAKFMTKAGTGPVES